MPSPQNKPPKMELSYNSREYGKSFKAWQVFIASSRRGESAVYRTPEGDICSPSMVKQLINSEVRWCLDRLEQQMLVKKNAYMNLAVVPQSALEAEKRRYE